MSEVVIDASVAIKWVAPEALSEHAVALLEGPRLSAPDLLVAECANILWKKVARSEMKGDAAIVAAQAIERIEIELVPMRLLLAESLKLALELDHPAYDCLYLALALARDCRFVTADGRLVKKLAQTGGQRLRDCVLTLDVAPALFS
ncbi:MAG: type II toxin-antitoxin system VapC family toxin [Gammaproteobacteria bacterium]